MKYRIDFLGGSNGFRRFREGSLFNNSVSDNNAHRAMIAMDDFDKATDDVSLSVLNMIHKGMWLTYHAMHCYYFPDIYNPLTVNWKHAWFGPITARSTSRC